MKTTNLFDLDKTIAKDLLSGCEYPWQALSKIKAYIISLGKNLDKALFDEVSPNVWFQKRQRFSRLLTSAPHALSGKTRKFVTAHLSAEALSLGKTVWWEIPPR